MNFFSIRYTGRYTDLMVSIFRHKSPKPKLYWTPFVDLLLGPIRGVHFKKLGPIIITKKRWPIRGSNYIRRKNEIFHFALFELRTLTINSSDDSKFMFKKYKKAQKNAIFWYCVYSLEMEQTTGIEPAWSAWKAEVLPLNYTRIGWWLAGDLNPWPSD